MELELKEYLTPLRKWWWLLVAATLVAAVSSYWATRQQPLVYKSTATLMVGSAIENPNPSNNDLFITQRLASTYVDLANRASVRDATKEALGLNWLPEIAVRNVNDANFIDIVVTDTSPERAQAVAAELTRQLILRSPTAQAEDQERQAFVSERLDQYQTAIEETESQIAAKQEELGELISAREIQNVETEITALDSKLQTLETNYASLLQSTQRGATNTIRVIEPASLPNQPVDQRLAVTVLTAASIGFVLAASAAYLLEYMDDTVRTPGNVKKLTGLSTLAGIAQIESDDSKLITVSNPRSPTSEAFRVLRTGIQFSSVDTANRTLLVTSSISEEGKSTITANLAVVMAEAGNDVLLVDTDLRRPTQHHIFDLPNKRGLTSLLLEFDATEEDEAIQAKVNEIVQATRVEGLQVLTCGPIPPNPSELLGSTKMKSLLSTLADHFDFVVLDSPPLLSVTDAAVLSVQTDSTLLVAWSGKSRKAHVKQAVEQLRDVKANVVGCVLNALSPRDEGYNFYYYYRDPYYSYGERDQLAQQERASNGRLAERILHRQTRKLLGGKPLDQ
jgi:non-specific protein-tyrosine kinase